MQSKEDHGIKFAVALLLLIAAIVLAAGSWKSAPGGGHPLLVVGCGLVLLALYAGIIRLHQLECETCQQQVREDDDFATRNGPLVREPSADE